MLEAAASWNEMHRFIAQSADVSCMSFYATTLQKQVAFQSLLKLMQLMSASKGRPIARLTFGVAEGHSGHPLEVMLLSCWSGLTIQS